MGGLLSHTTREHSRSKKSSFESRLDKGLNMPSSFDILYQITEPGELQLYSTILKMPDRMCTKDLSKRTNNSDLF
jgi:hypothetical protein